MLLSASLLLLTITSGFLHCRGHSVHAPITGADDVDLVMLVSKMQQLQASVQRSYANLTPNNRTLCPETAENPAPPNRVNTTSRLAALRAVMIREGMDALVIYNGDQHLNSKPHFHRVLYISGFSGASGYAAVTRDKAGMWADGRYFLQADNQMDCNWILMKLGEAGYPSIQDWLASVVPVKGIVGADPRYMATGNWQKIEDRLAADNITMKSFNDTFDEIWTDGRPDLPNNPLIVHNLTFTGRSWQQKITDVRSKMATVQADVLVLAALDDIAWLFNLRGTDLPTTPLFDSFALVKPDSVRLYLRAFTTLISPENVRNHLDIDALGNCRTTGTSCIHVLEYDTMLENLIQEVASPAVKSIWVSTEYNYAIYSDVQAKRYVARSPIQLMKAVKNPVEQENYYKCQIRDSAAVVEYVSFLEDRIQNGETWTELDGSAKLTEIRSRDPNYILWSFITISAAGSNAAIIHYRPDNVTNARITTDNVYLLDSGASYLDGTTDVTRTFHFGTPSDIVKESYTRVLMGHIELADLIWPAGLYGSDLAVVPRKALWSNGLDYRHGTGHGIGYGLGVHEGPGRINIGFSSQWEPLEAGMFMSDEPGYYEDGEYGIRLENILVIREADTPNNFGGMTFLEFNAATLVPFEPKLIKYEMLNEKHRQWLNKYNKRVREETGKYILDKGMQQAYDWLMARTEPLQEVPIWDTNSGIKHEVSLILAALSIVVTQALRAFCI